MQGRSLVLIIAMIIAIVVAVAAFLAVLGTPTNINEIGRALLVSTFGGVLGFCTTILIARMLAD